MGNVPDINALAAILGCKVASFPLKYLGLSLGAPFKTKSIWNGVAEKTCELEETLLSKGDKITLIKKHFG